MSGTDPMWGLLAKAVDQLAKCCLTLRLREQARSHKGFMFCCWI